MVTVPAGPGRTFTNLNGGVGDRLGTIPVSPGKSVTAMQSGARMKRWTTLVVAAVVAGGAVYWWSGRKGDAQEVAYLTAAAERGDLLAVVSATGTVEPEEVVDVGAQVAGMVRDFGADPRDSTRTVDYGTEVEAGTVLARIDDAVYRGQLNRAQAQLAQAEAALDQAKAQTAQAEANVRRAEADLGQMQAKADQADRDLARTASLVSSRALAAAEHESALATARSARSALAVGKAAIDQARAARDDAAASIARATATRDDARAALATAETNLGYCTITSPVRGVIIDRRVNVGQTVVASLNTPSLFLIAKDLRRMQVWASVNEADIGQVRPGLPVRFTVDAHPDKVFRGTVAQVRLNALMTQNVVTYTVVVSCENPDGLLLPYLTANVDIEVNRRQDALLVPNSALRWQPETEQVAPDAREAAAALLAQAPGAARQRVVWVAEGRFVRPVAVTAGLTDGAATEIVAGAVRPGDAVVTGVAQAAGGSSGANPFVPRIPKKK